MNLEKKTLEQSDIEWLKKHELKEMDYNKMYPSNNNDNNKTYVSLDQLEVIDEEDKILAQKVKDSSSSITEESFENSAMDLTALGVQQQDIDKIYKELEAKLSETYDDNVFSTPNLVKIIKDANTTFQTLNSLDLIDEDTLEITKQAVIDAYGIYENKIKQYNLHPLKPTTKNDATPQMFNKNCQLIKGLIDKLSIDELKNINETTKTK